ncbi:MAG: potassium-transporting ATPase subunit A [SAR324 cluster bacterium]|nr:potassium-transporting ATPase subunit A [SAR324 cluster bacterium]
MQTFDWGTPVFLLGPLILVAPFLGKYIALVLEGKRTWMSYIFGPLENFLLFALGGKKEMTWQGYLKSLLIFNFTGGVILFGILIFQNYLPLNELNLDGVPLPLAFNITSSFITSTNWQAYLPETTLSYFSQMLGLSVQNFFSAATGICVLAVLARGFVARKGKTVGNFWADLSRIIVYILLPFSIAFAIFLLSQGVIQNFSAPLSITTLEGDTQILAQGPAASQVAIKHLGTNGGGFFGANDAHPFENPTYLSNIFELGAILLFPFSLIFTFGYLIRDKRQAITLLSATLVLAIIFLGASFLGEISANQVSPENSIMEGKETRIGVVGSLLSVLSSNGSMNSSLESVSPLTGGVFLLSIALGDIIFGAAGSGLYCLILYVILTSFIAGMMIGRTPEYLGKKIETFEIKMSITAILVPTVLVLLGSGIILKFNLFNIELGPHGVTQVIYAFVSTANNNGSALSVFAQNELSHLVLGANMLIGKFIIITCVIAIAGNLAKKNKVRANKSSFPTDNGFFVLLLVSVILMGGLTFLPALSLGPILEHFLLLAGGNY